MNVPRRLRLPLVVLAAVAAVGAAVTLRLGCPDRVPVPEPVASGSGPPAGQPGGRVYPFRRVVAVVVGINHYPHLTGAADLACAEADARALADLLARNFGYEVVSLLGPAASKAAVEAAVRTYGRELGDREALIVYFAGHGQVVELPGRGEAGYLVPADARLDLNARTDAARWAEQAIDMQGLSELMEGATAQHVLFIADACCSGFMTARGSLERWDLKTFLSGRSRTVFTATTRRQLARENPADRHGYFTAALLDELRKDDAASVLDVYYPVLKAVTAKTNGAMCPQLAQLGTGDGMFVFVPQSIPRDEVESDLSGEWITATPERDRGVAGVMKRAMTRVTQWTTREDVYAAHAAGDYRAATNAEDLQHEWEQKFDRFLRNARAGDVWAMAALCCCYEKGLGTEKNPAQVYHWAQQASRARQPAGVGRYLLGRCYDRGLGAPLSGPAAKNRATQLFQESAQAGCALGRYAVGRGLLAGTPTKAEILLGRTHLEEAIAAGVLAGEYPLADELLRDRAGVPGDANRALDILEHAAQRGNRASHYRLFQYYAPGGTGTHVRDVKKAEGHLRRAVDLGSPEALGELGAAYRDGPDHPRGLKLSKDERRAFELFDRAAQAGDPTGLLESAKMLADGRGVGRNHALARERLDSAVRLGGVAADYLQGNWFLDGFVVPQSDQEALSCFVRGANKDSPNCCYLAGQLYHAGRGFSVRPRWKDASGPLFHQDWHVALHYLARARELAQAPGVGKAGREFNDLTLTPLRGFRAALLEDQDSFSLSYPGLATLASVSKSETERLFWFHRYTLAAPRIARDWARQYPGSFAWFCAQAQIDPVSLEETPVPLKGK